MEKLGSILQSKCRKALSQAIAQARSRRRLLVLSDDYYDTRLGYARSLSLMGPEGWWREVGVERVLGLCDRNCVDMVSSWSIGAVVFMLRGGDWRSARLAGEAVRRGRKRGWEGEVVIIVVWGGWGDVGTFTEVKNVVKMQVEGDKDDTRDVGLEENVRFVGCLLGFVPQGRNAVTLGDEYGFRRLMLEGDDGGLRITSRALKELLNALQREVGVVRAVGGAALAVAEDLINSSRDGLKRRKKTQKKGVFDARFPTLAELRDEQIPEKPLVDFVVIDRSIDLVTPLLTQWTYEGLLDEVFSLSGNLLSVDPTSIESTETASIIPQGGGQYNKLLTPSLDHLYAELQHESFSTISRILAERAKSVGSYYAARPDRGSATTTSSIKSYVEGLRGVKDSHAGVSTHTALSTEISAKIFENTEYKKRFETEQELLDGTAATGRVTYLVDCCAKGIKRMHVVRLSCLWSLTAGGIDRESLEMIRGEMIAAYGLQTALLLANLERAGLLVPSQNLTPESGQAQIMGFFTNLASFATSVNPLSGPQKDDRVGTKKIATYSWQYVRAAMALLEEYDPEAPAPVGLGKTKAIAAPYSGYVGLSVRFVQAGIDSWESLPRVPDHHSLLPQGQNTQQFDDHLDDRDEIRQFGRREKRSDNEKQDLGWDVVVVFVGGITRAEISAVRAAGLAKGLNLLIATTAIISGDQFLNAMDEKYKDVIV